MTALEIQLMEELEQEKQLNLELTERLEKQELNFINHLEKITQGFENELNNFAMNNNTILANQKEISDKLEKLNQQLTDMPDLKNELQVISQLHESM